MVLFIPPLDYRSLLPPLLACLTTAFASPRAPPSLLPLLSPILRQRVQLLGSTESSSGDSWLSLLCWKSDDAGKLIDLVKSDAFELHPVSGEIDFGDVEGIKYRWLDEETLQARINIPDLALAVQYLWCQGDQESGRDGWQVLNLTPLSGHEDTDSYKWHATISEAVESMGENVRLDTEDERSAQRRISMKHGANTENQNKIGADDDDQYWSRYNFGKSPESPRSSAPQTHHNAIRPNHFTSESEYFARYGQVQPEMDYDDPSQDQKALGESTLTGDTMMASMQHILVDKIDVSRANVSQSGSTIREKNSDANYSSAASSSTPSITVPRLEESAATQSAYEIVIRQHVSTSIKSLFRLSRGAGMDREEFDELVRTELDTLGMMAEND